jgi:formamidopyrimidine-DNA glycosylase
MPELPEVETVRRGLEPAMQGARILRAEARRPDLRFPLPEKFVERLQGRRILALSRRAKYLLADLDDGNVLVMHLGMSGSFRVRLGDNEAVPGEFHNERSALAVHDHVVFHLEGAAGLASVTYNDPRRFGFMDLVPRAGLEESRHFSGMGMEPLGNALDGGVLARLFEGKATPLKAALLDQKLVAGLGNIYACEALWQAGLSPRRSAGSVGGGKRADALSASIRDVLSRAIEAGGSTLRDHRLADGSLGYFQHSFNVYDREGQDCRRPGCGGTIRRIVQSGRSTFMCPKCQR